MEKFEDVLLSQRGGVGFIVLNRPKALNAITFEMVTCIQSALTAWEADDSIKAVVIEGAGDRSFCAGGDVIAVSKAGQVQDPLSQDFFQAEYRLNRTIHLFPKPYIAFLDGITMGGGVGLSVHGNCRIVTERTVFAMPETGIGLFPDVGGSHFLSRCPGQVGVYLGLTGARLGAADMLSIGLADLYMPSTARDAFFADLESADWSKGTPDQVVAACAARFAGDAGVAALDALRDTIDRIFEGASMEEILAQLQADDGAEAHTMLKHLSTKSPTLLKVSLEQLRRGAVQDFDTNMQMEYRLVRHALRPGSDFHEGVRALLIDKDKSPKWSPDKISAVQQADVDAFFQAPPEGDLEF
ncbi:MAG: enoyl-CoA hydratase/isomerase family protein [Alphaproteobacteria bacterium]|nr:enoyl-CoA hydratase/isomerase family protein [Alphaproteobacteria bacterium]